MDTLQHLVPAAAGISCRTRSSKQRQSLSPCDGMRRDSQGAVHILALHEEVAVPVQRLEGGP